MDLMVHAAVILTTLAKINLFGNAESLYVYLSMYLFMETIIKLDSQRNQPSCCRRLVPDGLPKQFRTSQGLKCLDLTEGARIRYFSKFVPKRIKELSDPVIDSFSSGTEFSLPIQVAT
jgi:hypothetical protein